MCETWQKHVPLAAIALSKSAVPTSLPVQHASLYPFGANVITELPPRHQRIHECLHDPRCLAAQCPPLASRSVQLRSGRTKVEAHTRRDEVVETHRRTPFPNYSGRQNPLDGFCTQRLQITSVVVQPVLVHISHDHLSVQVYHRLAARAATARARTMCSPLAHVLRSLQELMKCAPRRRMSGLSSPRKGQRLVISSRRLNTAPA